MSFRISSLPDRPVPHITDRIWLQNPAFAPYDFSVTIEDLATLFAGGGGGGVWGAISGTITDQLDLVAGFAAIGHNHAGVYSPIGHNHDASYAAIGHDHNLVYSLIGHGHAGVYSPVGHIHAQADVTNLVADLAAKAPVSQIPNASYRTILFASASHVAARAAGTYWLPIGNPAGVTGVGTLYSPSIIYLDPADYPTVNGLTTKLRIRAQIAVNDVAPTGNYTIGLHPITRPATSGGAAVMIYTVGAAVAGSTAVQNTPAADSHNTIVGADFAIPAAGFYVIGMVTTAAVAANSHVHINAQLQLRNT